MVLHRIDSRARSSASTRHSRRAHACRCASCPPSAARSPAARRPGARNQRRGRSEPAQHSGGSSAPRNSPPKRCPPSRAPQRIGSIALAQYQLQPALRSPSSLRSALLQKAREVSPGCTPPRQLGAGNTGNYSRGIPLGITATVRGDARSTDPLDHGILRNCSGARQAD